MAKSNPSPSLQTLFHLDEEDLVLIALGELQDPALLAHLQSCSHCTEHLRNARAILHVDALHSRAEPRRKAALMRRLEDLDLFPNSPPSSAFIGLVLENEHIRVVHTNTEVRIQENAVATRSAAPSEPPSAVAFFRQLGPIHAEIHLLRVSPDRFHIVVGLQPPHSPTLRISLVRNARRLSTQLAPHATATFKNLKPASYSLEFHDNGTHHGTIHIDVQSAS